MSVTVCYRLTTGELHPETLIALLGDLPFEAFQIELDQVGAYLPLSQNSLVVEAAVKQLAQRFALSLTIEILPDQNWNQIWEESFKPAEIDHFLRIRAPFHPPSTEFTYELEIIPEMSFGTGHHETTHLMVQYLSDFPPFGKTVFDFGTGTGVLALLAKLQGAVKVVATDIDPRCISSTLANAQRNDVSLDNVRIGDESTMPVGPFDLILANIQRSVLIPAMPSLAQLLETSGQLWLSGILVPDLVDIDAAAQAARLHLLETRQRGNWLACRFAFN